MIKTLLLVGLVACTFAHLHPVREEIVAEIKYKANTWTPMEVSENPLSKMTIEEIDGLMGLQIKKPTYKYPPKDMLIGAIPDSFDSRTKWAGCVHPIRNQLHCGSCWAFGGSETLSDRFCVASQGKVNVVLSAEDMVACDGWDFGCSGGNLMFAWDYLTSTGIVSDACFPYVSGDGTVPKCIAKGQCASADATY